MTQASTPVYEALYLNNLADTIGAAWPKGLNPHLVITGCILVLALCASPRLVPISTAAVALLTLALATVC